MESGASKYYLRVAVLGSRNYGDSLRVKDWLFGLRGKLGNRLVVLSGGDGLGAELYAKQHALELGIKYAEYNSPTTPKNAHSAMYDGFYDQPYKVWHYKRQYDELLKAADVVVYFTPAPRDGALDPVEKHLAHVKKRCEKLGKKLILYV